ncbi:hypothetical protein CPC08DRAFT_705680 [Agrocybe pediades]|nr:hypothetical protein CPC08DRAFT_705680 [Agrocybe pediades]
MKTVQTSPSAPELKRRRRVSTLFSNVASPDKRVLQHHSLPTEIWSLICALLNQHDLTRLARVSSTLLHISRPFLYRNVVLRNDSPSLEYQAAAVRHYASSVLRLTLFTSAWMPRVFNTPEPTTFVDYVLMSELPRLREVVLIGTPFTVEQEQINFVSFLRRLAPQCKSFTYVPHYLTYFPSLNLPIDGLESLSWYTYVAKSPQPQAISLLATSAQTLTSISFPNCPGFAYSMPEFSQDTWGLLFSMQFPRLTSFGLGLMYAQPTLERRQDTTTLLTQFLKDHTSIQDLTLGCSLQFPGLYEGLSGVGDLIQQDFLPNLRSLESHPANITIMLNQNVKSLQSLNKLTILYYCETSDAPLESLFAVMRGSAGFPDVERLSIRFTGDVKFMGVHQITMFECVRRLGACCPSVRSFSGYLGLFVSPTELSETLQYFRLLETIELPWTMLKGNQGVFTPHEDFLPITTACPALSTIIINTPASNHSKFSFERYPDGYLSCIKVSPRS